MFYSTGVYIYC